MTKDGTRRSAATAKGECQLAELIQAHPEAGWHVEGATTFFGRCKGGRICIERGNHSMQWVVSRMGRDGSQTMHSAPSPLRALALAGVMG